MNRKTGIIINKRAYKWISFLIIFLISILISNDFNNNLYQDGSLWYGISADNSIGPSIQNANSSENYKEIIFTELIKIFGSWGGNILISFITAICFSICLPLLIIGKEIDSCKEIFRTLGAYLIFIWIWGKYILFPQSEFIAMFFFIAAVTILYSVPKKNSIMLYIKVFTAGFLLYEAFNIHRFMISGIIPIIIIFFFSLKNQIRTRIIVFSVLVFGIIISVVFQHIIFRNSGITFSASSTVQQLQNTQIEQIFEGLTVSRSETYQNITDFNSDIRIDFRNKIGEEILRRRHLSRDNFKLSTFVKLFFEFPLDMAGIYFRHLISLMTPDFSYVLGYGNKTIVLIISVLIWIIGGLGVIKQFKRNKIFLHHYYVFAICIPGFLQIFFVPYVRLFLMIYLFCYYFVFAVIDYKEMRVCFYNNWILITACVIIFIILWITVYSDFLGSNALPILLIQDSIRNW